MNNLYERLHKYTERWDEDFLTEALVHFLNYLKNCDKPAFSMTIAFLIDESVDLVHSFRDLRVESQFTIPGGRRPDIFIGCEGVIALIEVKVDANLGHAQISAYRKFVDEQVDQSLRKLITLTRFDERGKFSFVDHSIKWASLADWLNDAFTSSDPVSNYLANELYEFLNIRGVVMQKVGMDLVSGLEALKSFKEMLLTVLSSMSEVGEVGSESRGNNDTGYNFLIQGPSGESLKAWFGIEYECPTELIAYLLDADLDFNTQTEHGNISKKYRNWWISQDLSADSVQFFQKNKDEQCEFLAGFVNSATHYAIEVYRKDRQSKLADSFKPRQTRQE